jgi:alpha-galactosidase
VSNPNYPAQYWSGNSSDGVVFMILNKLDTPQSMFFNLTESWAIKAGRRYLVYDMWSHTHNGTAVRNMTPDLPAHGVAALLLNDDGPEPEGCFRIVRRIDSVRFRMERTRPTRQLGGH